MSGLAAAIVAVDPGRFWFLTLFVLATAGIALGCGFARLHRKRLVEDTATSRIRSAAQGYVELEGHGEWLDGGELSAPLSGKPCTWYRYSVEQRETVLSTRQRERRWRTIERGVSNEFFSLVDASGSCVIDPEGAQVIPAVREVWYGRIPHPGRGPAGAPRWGFGLPFRYTEERLQPGEALYAIGQFIATGGAGAAGPLPGEVRDLLRSWKADRAALHARFDADRNGAIDPAEWERARAAAEQEVLRARIETGPAPVVELLRRTDDPRRPFVLSAIPQETLRRRLRQQSLGLLGYGLIAGSAAVWALLVRWSA